MLRLLLDGKEAVIKKNSSFKFTRENQLLSEQGEYSMQITLPIKDCPENQMIFGQINRTQSDTINDGVYSIQTEVFTNNGKYRVTEVNENEVKIQIMAKKTRANYDFKDKEGNELYIDEMDLGFFYDEWNWNEHPLYDDWPINIQYPPKSIDDYRNFVNAMPGMSTWTHEEGLEHHIDGYNCLLKATKSIVDEKIVNYDFYQYTPETTIWTKTGSFCFQPTLIDILKRIFEKGIGIKFYHNFSWEKQHVYMASLTSEYEIAKMLPHWTVKEFLNEICNFFDAVLKYDDNSVTIMDKEDFYEKEAQNINRVVDEYTAQINEEDKEQFSFAGNVDYKWNDEDPMLRLPEEVWERAIIKEFDNTHEIQDFVDSLGENKSKSQYVLIDKQYNEVYAILENEETKKFDRYRVDWYGPLLRNKKSREIQTYLRITPIRLYVNEKGWIMGMNDSIISQEDFSVNNEIKPNAETGNSNPENKRDVIEVFYWDGYVKVKNSSCPLGVMVAVNETTNLSEYIPFENNRSAYIDPRGPFCLDRMFTQHDSEIVRDTKKEYQFKFLKQRGVDIDKPFLINGQKYICKKLEYDVDEKGVKPIIQGYFYRI